MPAGRKNAPRVNQASAATAAPTLLIAAMPATAVGEVDRSVFDGGGAMLVLHQTVKNEKHAKASSKCFCTCGAAERAGDPQQHRSGSTKNSSSSR